MKKNIKELIMLIQSKYREMDKITSTASNDKYTAYGTSHEEVLAEKTNLIDTTFDELDKISEEILRLQSIRNDINMKTYGIFKGTEYRLIDLIIFIKIKQEQYDNTKSLIATGSSQTKKEFNSSIGANIYREFNGNVALLKDRQEQLRSDIDELQAIVDMLNITTYVEI